MFYKKSFVIEFNKRKASFKTIIQHMLAVMISDHQSDFQYGKKHREIDKNVC